MLATVTSLGEANGPRFCKRNQAQESLRAPTNCRDAGLETGNLRALGVFIASCDGLRHVWSLWASNPEYILADCTVIRLVLWTN
ncbi:hypothetical protein PRUPE_3G040300 [Prunus persica]|uniref:Uncharacterized protein n=1 Tax=Prunus persica TaxID=3760 RepID=A0A251PUX5_PRUPE|nr:hypothetical protein PRUPE_3G040300 [Prunus persica]